jgi:hypothetical protein
MGLALISRVAAENAQRSSTPNRSSLAPVVPEERRKLK